MKNHKTNHVLHFIVTLLTGGFWVIIWILLALNNKAKNDAEQDLRDIKNKCIQESKEMRQIELLEIIASNK